MGSNEIDDFDYDFYLDSYEDLRGMTPENAVYHWKTYGKYENRKCNRKNLVNYVTNITIVIHLFHEDLLDEFIGYVNDVKKVFNVVNVIFTIKKNSNLDETIKNIDPRFVALKVENKGVDIYPFLESVRYMREHFKTDYVLKIHSKVSTNEMYGNWRQKLIVPITSYKNLIILQHYFKKLPNIGYVGAQFCCLQKNYDAVVFPQNIEGLEQLCKQFPYLNKDWTDFMGGTMFWISNDALNDLTDEIMDYISERVSYGKPPCNLTENGIHIEYVCERLFTGVMCYDKTNILINEYESSERIFNIKDEEIDDTYFYNPKVFSIFQPKNLVLN